MKKKQEEKGSQKIVRFALFLVFICVFCIGIYGLGGGGFLRSQTSAEDADALYEEVVAEDLFDHYPETPEAVAAFYDKTMLVLYDANLTDEDMLKKALSKQRALYARELLDLNSLEEQLAQLTASRNELFRKRISIKSFEHPEITYTEDPKYGEVCEVKTIQVLSGENDLYFIYNMVRSEEGRWQIISRDSVDKNFAPVLTW